MYIHRTNLCTHKTKRNNESTVLSEISNYFTTLITGVDQGGGGA